MARCPDWYELRNQRVEGHNLVFDIKVKYIPARIFLKILQDNIGYRFWLYPKVIRICLDRIGFVFRCQF